jgi:hypothetical protein
MRMPKCLLQFNIRPNSFTAQVIDYQNPDWLIRLLKDWTMLEWVMRCWLSTVEQKGFKVAITNMLLKRVGKKFMSCRCSLVSSSALCIQQFNTPGFMLVNSSNSVELEILQLGEMNSNLAD